MTHETGGSVPSAAASKNSVLERTLPSLWFLATAENPGSGFCTGAVT